MKVKKVKKTKKAFKNIISLICLCIIFVLIGNLLRFILIDDTSSYTRIMMHQLYNTENNIDVAFLGSSHAFRSFVPKIIDEGLGSGVHTFNAGSALQNLDASLILLKEILKNNDVKTIYLEMYYKIAIQPENCDRTEMTSTYIISDYLKPSFRKVGYILQASSKDYWVNSFIIARRNWSKLLNFDYIKELIKKKGSEEYKSFKWKKRGEKSQTEYYVDRGFVESNVVWKDNCWIPPNTKVEIGDISDDWKKSLFEIIRVCKKNNVKLVLLTAPIPERVLVGTEDYDEYLKYIQRIAKKENLEFYDFNLIKSKYFNTNEKLYFMDEGHLNGKGASVFSKVFCNYITDKYVNERVFYSSLREKLDRDIPKVYGLTTMISDKKKEIKTSYIVANKDKGIEYKIIAKIRNGKEIRLIQDFSENRDIVLPIKEKGELSIIWREIGNIKEHNITVEY